MAVISNAVTIADAGSFSASLGSLVHIKTLTASNSANLSFVHGSASVVLDGTYPTYLFKFINIHPVSNDADFGVSFRDGGSDYDAVKTTIFYRAYHGGVGYDSEDEAQSTARQRFIKGIGSENDESGSGELFLFNPSNTTFVKHFISRGISYPANDDVMDIYTQGYLNTATAIDGVRFDFHSGNISTGAIKLYGIKGS